MAPRARAPLVHCSAFHATLWPHHMAQTSACEQWDLRPLRPLHLNTAGKSAAWMRCAIPYTNPCSKLFYTSIC
jgi:hypothetical protein